MTPPRELAWYSPRHLLRALLMLDGSPHSIALGTAIGMFIALTPTVGIQMLIVIAVAFLVRPLFRFNRMAALITVYVSNPLTVVPLYWFNYKLGTIVIPETISHERFQALIEGQPGGTWAEWWASLLSRTWSLIGEVGGPLIAGSLVVATIAALATYPIILRVMERVRSHRRKSKRPQARTQEMETVAY